MAAVTQNGAALAFASPGIILCSIGEDGNALQGLSKTHQNIKEIVLPAVTQNGLALQFASTKLKSSLEILKVANSTQSKVT